MADCGRSSATVDHHLSSFAQCADELFDQIAIEETVSSQPAGLVKALADLHFHVSEDHVVEATRQILQSTEEEFSKDTFLRFLGCVRLQLSTPEDSEEHRKTDSQGDVVGGRCATLARGLRQDLQMGPFAMLHHQARPHEGWEPTNHARHY